MADNKRNNKKNDRKNDEDYNPRFRKMRKKVCPCLLYTSPSPRDRTRSRMPSSA